MLLDQIRLFNSDQNNMDFDIDNYVSECEELVIGNDSNKNGIFNVRDDYLIENKNSFYLNDEEKFNITQNVFFFKEENNPLTKIEEPTKLINDISIHDDIASKYIKTENKIPLSKLMNFFREKIRIKSEAEKIAEIERKSKKNENNLESGSMIRFSQLNAISYSLKRTNFICEREHNKLTSKVFDLEILEKNNSRETKLSEIPEKNNVEEIKCENEVTEINRQNEKYKRKVIPNANYVLCLFCGEVFLKREFRQEHLFLHTDDLEIHKLVIEHMSTSATKVFRCNECDSVFNRQLALIEHINEQHEKIRPVKCHLCDRRFPGIKRIRAHVRSSHQVKTFKCDMCSYVSKNVPDLDKHKLGVHSNEKIMCNVCGKLLSAFHHNLKKHLETHNDTRPYKCDLCEMAYKTRGTLAKHRENIHFPVSIMCSLCGTISASKLKYKKHVYKCRRKNKKIVC